LFALGNPRGIPDAIGADEHEERVTYTTRQNFCNIFV